MAKSKKIFGFNEDGFRRVVEATRRVLKTPSVGSQRRRQNPIVGGGGGGCDAQNAIILITIIGKPTGGTFVINLTVFGTLQAMTFNWNDNAATVQSGLISGHPNIATGDVSVTGGPFPNGNMMIEFQGALENTEIAIPYCSWASLTGGTGMAIIPSFIQRGHAS